MLRGLSVLSVHWNAGQQNRSRHPSSCSAVGLLSGAWSVQLSSREKTAPRSPFSRTPRHFELGLLQRPPLCSPDRVSSVQLGKTGLSNTALLSRQVPIANLRWSLFPHTSKLSLVFSLRSLRCLRVSSLSWDVLSGWVAPLGCPSPMPSQPSSGLERSSLVFLPSLPFPSFRTLTFFKV